MRIRWGGGGNHRPSAWREEGVSPWEGGQWTRRGSRAVVNPAVSVRQPHRWSRGCIIIPTALHIHTLMVSWDVISKRFSWSAAPRAAPPPGRY